MAMSLWADFFFDQGETQTGERGRTVPFVCDPTAFASKQMQLTLPWLMAARRIGKRLVALDPPTVSQLSHETHEVICGVAGCVVRRKKLRRVRE